MEATREIGNPRTRQIATFGAALGTTMGTLALIGWVTGLDGLRRLLPGPLVVLPMTASCFVLAGIALLLAVHRPTDRRARAVTRACAVVVLAAGTATTLEWLFDANLGIDGLLFPQAVRAYPFLPAGRMAPNSAVAFVLLGAALLVIDLQLRGRWLLPTVLAGLALTIAGVALIGHLYGAHPLYAIDPVSGMALATAIAFVALSTGVLFARPSRSGIVLLMSRGTEGVLARELIAATLLAPLFLGWLLIRMRDREAISHEGGIALFVVIVMGLLGGLILRGAHIVREAREQREQVLAREQEARDDADRARVRAEQASRAKSDFLATMSHELRTPLNAILGYSSLLSEGIPEPVTAGQRAQLARIGVSAQHLLILIDEVLTLSRLEAGREDVRPTTCRVDELVEQTSMMVEPMAREKELRFTWRTPPGDVTIETDAPRLRQALINLATNAVKFTEDGEVSIEAREDGDAICFVVADTGIGIAPEHLERVFDSFWQVQQSTTRRVGGAGLGLAVTRRLARLLGGDVSVDSRPGEGSTFTLRLPRRWHVASTPELAMSGNE